MYNAPTHEPTDKPSDCSSLSGIQYLNRIHSNCGLDKFTEVG